MTDIRTNPVFLLQIRNRVLLLPVDEAGENDNEEVPGEIAHGNE